MAVAIRTWDGSNWVSPKYYLGPAANPKWQGYNPGTLIPHMNDTFGVAADREWIGTTTATTPEGDKYIYSERSGMHRLEDALQQPPALPNVGKMGRLQVAVRAQGLSGTPSLAGLSFRFEVWDAFVNPPNLPNPPDILPGSMLYEYQTGEFPDTLDTGWVTYEPPGVYEVRAGVPEFHRLILHGSTENVTTRLSLSRWTVIDAATDTIMGYNPLNETEVIPKFWDGTAWIPQTME